MVIVGSVDSAEKSNVRKLLRPTIIYIFEPPTLTRPRVLLMSTLIKCRLLLGRSYLESVDKVATKLIVPTKKECPTNVLTGQINKIRLHR